MTLPFRVGIGTDLHRIESGRPLILGGIEIESPWGLAGHSDADVVLHAITDALLGAAGLPDIGECFPDTDPRYAGADSSALLAETMERITGAGFVPINIDVVVHAEAPKLSGHKQAMRASIANLLHLPVDRVNVKAKTSEGVGPVGRREALSCTAIAALELLQSTDSGK
ncbi:MAG: 2-C-methyl-D-erythritol 2,4-cyclodiphosphate synthase [Planctomycetota bacterium]|jgi:2-C-methyl-D-erythritol 2,4-cyclodiphosphate synthase